MMSTLTLFFRVLAARALLAAGLAALALALAGCSPAPAPTPTLTPPPATPTATASSTPTPTHSPQPTPTPLSTVVYGAGIPLPQRLTPITAANAGQLTLLARWGDKGEIRSIEWSPDGRWLAVQTFLGVYLYDTGTFALVRTVADWARGGGAAFGPDGKLMVTYRYDGVQPVTRLRRTSDGYLLHEFEGGDAMFSPDGALLATTIHTAQYEDFVRLWRTDNGELAGEWPGNGSGFSPDGKYFATYDMDDQAQLYTELWHTSDGSLVSRVWGERVAFSRDGGWYATTDFINRGRDTSALYRIGTPGFRRHLDGLLQAFSPRGTWVATLPYARNDPVQLWSTSTEGPAREIPCGEPGTDCSMQFSPDETLLATDAGLYRIGDGTRVGSAEGQRALFSPGGERLLTTSGSAIHLWGTSDGSLVTTLSDGPYAPGTPYAFSPDGALLAAADGATGSVRLWRSSDGSRVSVLTGFMASLDTAVSPTFSPDGTLVATTHCGLTSLWDTRSGSLVRKLNGHFGAFGPDGTVWVYGEGGAEMQRLSDGSLVRRFDGHWPALSADGAWVVTNGPSDCPGCSYPFRLWLWRVSTGALAQTFTCTGPPYSSPEDCDRQLSPDGSLLAIGAPAREERGEETQLWSTGDGQLVRQLVGNSPVFSPDGTLLATWSRVDSSVRLWRASDGVLLHRFPAELTEVAFSADSALLATGGGVYRTSDGSQICGCSGHSMIFSPDGSLLLTSNTPLVQLWRVSDCIVVQEVTGWGATLSPDGTLLLASVGEGYVVRGLAP